MEGKKLRGTPCAGWLYGNKKDFSASSEELSDGKEVCMGREYLRDFVNGTFSV